MLRSAGSSALIPRSQSKNKLRGKYITMELLEGIDQSELMGMAGLLVDLTPSNGEFRLA